MSQNFRLIATLDLKAGAWDKVSAVLKECVIQTRKEEGNSFYTAHFEQNNQNRIVFIEDWANQEVLDIHMQTEHFKKLAKALEPYLEGPMQVAKLTEIKI